MRCLLCPASTVSTLLCGADWGRWAASPEALRADAILKSGDALAEKRMRVALMDFVRRVQAESQTTR